jgi:hypothetical protein
MVNETQNFPSIEGADDAQPEWWEESAGTATLTEVDITGESITETWDRGLKVVTTADVYAYQRYTYADEQRLKSGRVVSGRWAVWAVGGATARVRIQSSSGSLGVQTTTAAAWTILTVDNVTLNGTYVEQRLEVNNGTAYFIPLGFGIGTTASNDLKPRGLRLRSRDSTVVKDASSLGDEATWTDVDCTTATSPLAVAAHLALQFFENDASTVFVLYLRRKGSSEAAPTLERVTVDGGDAERAASEVMMFFDDGQVFQYYLDRVAGTSTLNSGFIRIAHWWEWE